MRPHPMKVLELYCGIGGLSAAVTSLTQTVMAAVDIDRTALAVYETNFPHRTVAAEIATLDLAAFDADFWWLSPPCRPFTRRGHGRDIDDPRSQSFLSLIERLPDHRPVGLGLENVPPFADSVAADRLRQTLDDRGYVWEETIRCPTQFGIPMRRKRFYLMARRKDCASGSQETTPRFTERAERLDAGSNRKTLREYLDPSDTPADLVPAEWLERYAEAVDILDADDAQAVAACFTSAYGRSPVRSGSYLREAERIRFFRPREIARLMGFDDSFDLPASSRTAYRLLGNSLAIPVVRHLMMTSFGKPSSDQTISAAGRSFTDEAE